MLREHFTRTTGGVVARGFHALLYGRIHQSSRSETRLAAPDTQLEPGTSVELDCEIKIIDLRQEILGGAAAMG